MDAILSKFTMSITEFKKNPTAAIKGAKKEPVAVLNHSKAAFYAVEPKLFEALIEDFRDRELHRKALLRGAELDRAVEVSLDDL
jgi:antitoxin StbD